MTIWQKLYEYFDDILEGRKRPSLEEELLRTRFEEILPKLTLTDFEKYCQGVKDGK